MYELLFTKEVHSMKNSIRVFIDKNKLITAFFAISVAVIVAYFLSIDLPEWFNGAGDWFNLLFQLAVGYIINFMFYVTQVYVPNNKRNAIVEACIAKRISLLIADMDKSLSHLVAIYIENHTGTEYTEDELQQILHKLRLSDKVDVIDAGKTKGTDFVYFTVRAWLANCIFETERDIDSLFKYYAADIPVELMEILEKIPRSTYHSVMRTLLAAQDDVDFSGAASDPKSNFFVEYYNLIQELRQKNS